MARAVDRRRAARGQPQRESPTAIALQIQIAKRAHMPTNSRSQFFDGQMRFVAGGGEKKARARRTVCPT